MILAFAGLNYEWMPALLFVLFLLYGFIRPLLTKGMRREIEDEEDHETP
jgi:CDP-diacylglycerol--serine O-phosphatidyltransferase